MISTPHTYEPKEEWMLIEKKFPTIMVSDDSSSCSNINDSFAVHSVESTFDSEGTARSSQLDSLLKVGLDVVKNSGEGLCNS